MSYQTFSFKTTLKTVTNLIIVFIIILLTACTDNKEGSSVPQTDNSTTKQKNDSADLANSDIKRFPRLRISSDDLQRIFFNNDFESDFKKMLLNFTINDYGNFPRTLTLDCIGADNDNIPVPEISKKLDFVIDANGDIVTDPIDIINLLYTTNELSKRKIKKLVKENGQWRVFEYLIFIPTLLEKDGKKYLHYKVKRKDKNKDLLEGDLETNPCPPNRPND